MPNTRQKQELNNECLRNVYKMTNHHRLSLPRFFLLNKWFLGSRSCHAENSSGLSLIEINTSRNISTIRIDCPPNSHQTFPDTMFLYWSTFHTGYLVVQQGRFGNLKRKHIITYLEKPSYQIIPTT